MPDKNMDLLTQVNDQYNKIPYVAEPDDNWQTPQELAKNGGDCEDIAIAKYFALVDSGIPRAQLKITYVNKQGNPHMLLTHRGMDGKTTELDLDGIRPKTYEPIYSFNDFGVYTGEKRAGPPEQVGPWAELNKKMGRKFKSE